MTHSAFSCHICGAAALENIKGYGALNRVTSDCRPWVPGGRLALCTRCGLLQKPVDASWEDETARLYAGYTLYHQGGGKEQAVFDEGGQEGVPRSSKLAEKLRAFLPPRGRLLDIGCGNGAFLRRFAAAFPDWSLSGTELGEAHIREVEAIPQVERVYCRSPGKSANGSKKHAPPSAFMAPMTTHPTPPMPFERRSPAPMRRAVFLDRDGVLLEDVHGLVREAQIALFPDVAETLALLRRQGFLLVVVTNQTVVARGLATESRVAELNREIGNRIAAAGGPPPDAFYVCPHHPNATLPEYRVVCECRKPRAGLLLQAAGDWGIDLRKSFLVGDRLSDIAAGVRAGCGTILVETGEHRAPPIETAEPQELDVRPDYRCKTLRDAERWIRRMASLS